MQSYLLIGIFMLSAVKLCCQNSTDTLRYIFLGHTYDWQADGSKVDPRIEQLEFSGYKRIWLGGDICSEASLKYSTVEYIVNLFNLSNPANHWSLGNHDIRNGNVEWIEELTKRKTYYAYERDGIVTINLNTNLTPADCENLNKQWVIIQNVCDTIKKSSHLFLLMHHGITDGVPGIPPPSTFGHSNLKYWNASCFDVESTFANAVYPLLLNVKSKGIEVFLIMGDAGTQSKEFHMPSADGIHFFASGINNSYYTDPVELANAPKDKVLIFEHIPTEKKLEWKFHDLDSLLSSQ
ncbi:MAG: hypothetical protein COA57_04745 [Flavobacteriales bacterium]|nr:MAG: hypothetical protein COA57_04745 [Flavobacteriales bacterium]